MFKINFFFCRKMSLLNLIILIVALYSRTLFALSIVRKYPFVGSLNFPDFAIPYRHHCNVILIDQLTSVTAARCLLLEPSLQKNAKLPLDKYRAYVIAGSDDHTDWNNTDLQKSLVTRVYFHKKAEYGLQFPFENKFDLAVIKVEKAFLLSQTVKKMSMEMSDRSFHIIASPMAAFQEKCVVVGWGLTPYPNDTRSEPVYRQTTVIQQAPVQMYTIHKMCSTFFGGSLKRCLNEFENSNSYPYAAVGGLGEKAPGAPVVCQRKEDLYVFAIHTGSLSGCYKYSCPQAREWVPVGTIDLPNLREFTQRYEGLSWDF